MNKSFKTPNGDYHMIDTAGNHFVNHRCANPLVTDEGLYTEIGDTHPHPQDRTELPEITGKAV